MEIEMFYSLKFADKERKLSIIPVRLYQQVRNNIFVEFIV